MARHLSDYLPASVQPRAQQAQKQLQHLEPKQRVGLIGLVVLLVLGAVGWQLFGADLRRYLKIKSM